MDPHTAFIAGVIVLALLSLAWHEAAHAWVADRLGDPTARQLGRVTLNPLRHLDPFLSLILPAIMYFSTGMIFGGGKPVPINPMNFRHRTRGFMLVALAGPFSNLALAVLFCLIYTVFAWFGVFQHEGITQETAYGTITVDGAPSMVRAVQRILKGGELDTVGESWLVYGFGLNVLLAVFNLTPIPPLDGSRFVGWLLPRSLQRSWYALDRIGLILVLVTLLLLGGIKWVFAAVMIVAFYYAEVTDWLVSLSPIS